MKYLKLDDLFLAAGAQGEAFKIDSVPTTKAGMLALTMNAYHPMDAGRVLSMPELRSYNKVLDILQGPPQEDEYHRFEDADFLVLVKTIEWTAPVVPWCRQAPLLVDLLAEASATLPTPALPTVNGFAPESVVAPIGG